jgi:hypothetical protein
LAHWDNLCFPIKFFILGKFLDFLCISFKIKTLCK